MNELKAYLCVQAREIEHKTFSCYKQTLAFKNAPNASMAEVYLKSEADKAIADLEESHKMEVEQLLMEIVEKDAENSRLKCELDLWRDGNIIREETLNEINSAHRALCRLRIGFAKHFGRVNSGKKIVAYWKAKVEKFKEAI